MESDGEPEGRRLVAKWRSVVQRCYTDRSLVGNVATWQEKFTVTQTLTGSSFKQTTTRFHPQPLPPSKHFTRRLYVIKLLFHWQIYSWKCYNLAGEGHSNMSSSGSRVSKAQCLGLTTTKDLAHNHFQIPNLFNLLTSLDAIASVHNRFFGRQCGRNCTM